LIFEWLGESRFNRRWEEYAQIAARVPKLEALHAYINQRLREIAESGQPPYEICYFRPGDICYFRPGDKYRDKYRYAEFPASLSKTTIRKALINSGMAALKRPVTR
jgi:hypothetical protein